MAKSFDWDNYEAVEQTQKKFDWNDHPVAGSENISGGQSAQRGLEQGATFGFYDELAGAAEAAGQAVGVRGLGANSFSELGVQSPNGLNLDRLRQAYQERRDKQRSEAHDARAANPKSYLTGELVGGVASGLLVPGGSTKTLAQAMKTGAAYGTAQGLGSSEADSLGGLAIDTGFGTLVGAAGGATGYGLAKGVEKVGEKAAPYVEKGKRYIGEKLQDLGDMAAFKSSGAMLKDWRAARRDGSAKKIGRYMLENGLKVGDDVEDVAEKFGAQKTAAGQKLDSIYENAGEKFKEVIDKVGFDPKRDKGEIIAAARAELGDTEGAEAAINRLSKYLDEVADRHGDKPMEEALAAYKRDVNAYLPKFKQFLRQKSEYQNALGKAADDLDQPVLGGMIDDLQRTSRRPEPVELAGVDASSSNPVMSGLEILPKKVVITEEIPGQIPTRGQTQIPVEPSVPARPVRPSDIRNPMSPRRTNDIKGALDERIKYSRNPLQPDPAAERAFYAARTKISQKVDDAIESLGDEGVLAELKAANKKYGMSKRVSDIAKDRVDRESANKWFGLTDTIMGGASLGYGATTGDWETAAKVMIGKKVIEKYGATSIAVAADRISKRLLASPQIRQIATDQPQVFKAAVINLTRKTFEGTERVAGTEGSAPGAGGVGRQWRWRPQKDRRSYPDSSDNDSPKRGEEKWLDAGLGNLMASADEQTGQMLDARSNELMQSPKGRHLIMAASDLKPGSAAMKQLMTQLMNELGRGPG